MDNLGFGLQITVLGLGIVFGVLILLWLLLTAAMRLDARATAARAATTRSPTAPGPRPAARVTGLPGDLEPALVAAITVALLHHAESRRLQAAPEMRTYWPGSLLFASRWVSAGRTRQAQPWRRRR